MTGFLILFFMIAISLGVAVAIGMFIYAIIKRLNENEPYERRDN